MDPILQYLPEVEFGSFDDLSVEQRIRLTLIELLIERQVVLHKGLTKQAEQLANYILNGIDKTETSDSSGVSEKITKKLEVHLPGLHTYPFERVMSQAYLMDDGHIEIQFQNPQHAADIFDLIDRDFENVSLSFNYRPAQPTKNEKEA